MASTSEQQTQARYDESKSFLDGLFHATEASAASRQGRRRPQVTLTFAQTVDGCISGEQGRQLRLSGDESMAMTHYLRTLHDAILVGVGTVLNDNPRLNGEHTAQASASVALAHASVILSARLLPNPPPAEKQPQPIVLDTHLRTPPDARLLTNYRAGGGRQPIILCSQTKAKEELRSALEAAGALVVPLPSMGWPHILDALGSQVGVQRLMVEGGAKVIETLLTAADSDGNGRPGDLIDSLIITVSPNFAGSDATGYKSPRWRDVVVQTGKASVAPKAGEKGKEGAPFHVCKKAWFGDDAVWMWKRGEKGA